MAPRSSRKRLPPTRDTEVSTRIVFWLANKAHAQLKAAVYNRGLSLQQWAEEAAANEISNGKKPRSGG